MKLWRIMIRKSKNPNYSKIKVNLKEKKNQTYGIILKKKR